MCLRHCKTRDRSVLYNVHLNHKPLYPDVIYLDSPGRKSHWGDKLHCFGASKTTLRGPQWPNYNNILRIICRQSLTANKGESCLIRGISGARSSSSTTSTVRCVIAVGA